MILVWSYLGINYDHKVKLGTQHKYIAKMHMPLCRRIYIYI